MGTIKIKGYASKEVYADTIEINISFLAKDNKISDALKETKRQSEVFLKEMKQIGIEPDMFQLAKDYSNSDNYDESKPKTAKRTITLCQEYDPKLINAVISVITKNHLDVCIDTNYRYSKQKELEKELLQKAIENSRSKAEVIAKANEQTVKYAESISDDRDDCYDKKDYGDVLAGPVTGILFDEDLLSNTLSAKKIEYSQTIYVTWVIE